MLVPEGWKSYKYFGKKTKKKCLKNRNNKMSKNQILSFQKSIFKMTPKKTEHVT